MLRFYYVIIITIPLIIYYILRCRYMIRHADRYSEEDCYLVLKHIIRDLMFFGRIRTKAFGLENLPQEGSYVMYPNHQGRFDALGIVYSHKNPCTIMMDKKRSEVILANEVIGVIKGCRLDKTSMRAQLEAITQVTKELKEGRKYIIFPEGGYYHNRNNVQDFLPGSFKCAVKAKCPIVPVALIDSYKPFEINSLRRVTTQVHYLKPLYYEDYKDLTTVQIAELVRNTILDTMRQILGEVETTDCTRLEKQEGEWGKVEV